jgi:DnaJ family protein A protein 2
VADEGMPVHGRPYEKGNLYIHFNVKFPDQLSQAQVSGLKQLLQQPRASTENGIMDVDTEQVCLRPTLKAAVIQMPSRGIILVFSVSGYPWHCLA